MLKEMKKKIHIEELFLQDSVSMLNCSVTVKLEKHLTNVAIFGRIVIRESVFYEKSTAIIISSLCAENKMQHISINTATIVHCSRGVMMHLELK